MLLLYYKKRELFKEGKIKELKITNIGNHIRRCSERGTRDN